MLACTKRKFVIITETRKKLPLLIYFNAVLDIVTDKQWQEVDSITVKQET